MLDFSKFEDPMIKVALAIAASGWAVALLVWVF